MKFRIFFVAIGLTFGYNAIAQVNRQGDATKVAKDTIPKIPGINKIYHVDTNVTLRLTTEKFNLLKQNNVDLGRTASELMEKYEINSVPKSTKKKVQRIEMAGDLVVIYYQDGSVEKVSTEYKKGEKDDSQVAISYPDAPSNEKLVTYTEVVNQHLESSLKAILPLTDWQKYANTENGQSVYEKIYRRIKLLSYLSKE